MRIPALFALALCAATAAAAALPFAQAESDLKADPAIRFGTLPNGVRYAVMANHEPKSRVSLRLLVLAGSFEETESQRGLAHYLEHMAFNGSTHFAPGTLIERLQRLGMGFGADTNAATSFDHTIYQLELPDTTAATLAEGLQIFEDYGGGLLLEPKMVDKERGIILSEKRTRDSVAYRTQVAQYAFMEGGTRIPERVPIGLSEVIEKASRDQFVDFYNAWYRPENYVVIVVGDIDPAAVEKEIVEGFSGLKARAPERAAPEMGAVADFKGTRVLYHPEPEAPDTQIAIAQTVPYSHEPDTAANRMKYLPRWLAVDMLNRRLEILAKKEGAPFTRASTFVDEEFDLLRISEISIWCKPTQWTDAMLVADKELRRALAFGFRPDEMKEEVANFKNEIEQAVKTAPTRRSEDLAGQIADSIVEKSVFTSPEDDLALYGPALDKVTAADCVQALRASWANPGRYVFLAGNLAIPQGADAVIQGAYERAEATDVRPTDAERNLSWGYGDFGPAGKVASRAHVDDLDITQVVFANGVRLNVKKTNFESDTIHVGIRIGTGQLTEPASEPGLATFARLTYQAGGLGKASVDELQRILAGKTVDASFSSSMDAFTLAGKTNREDLALQMQLLAAYISDPGYRLEAVRVARKRIDEAYLSFEHTLSGPLALQVPKLLSSGDPRFGLPSKEQMMGRNMNELKAWLEPQTSSGPLEVSVVGDVDPDAAIGAVAATLGALPQRGPKPNLDSLKKVSYPAVPFVKEFAIESKLPKALVGAYYPTADGIDNHRSRRLNMLAEVFSDRLRVKVREQMGGTYSPNVGSSASDIFPGYGYLAAVVEVDPARAKEIQDAIVSVAADLQANGATQDEIDRSKNPTLKHVDESERTNVYWMTVLARSQEKPEVLDWARDRRADFASISKADIDALAKAYLSPAKASRIIVRPYLTAPGAPLRTTPSPTPPPDG
ncbi:MAG TPA: insulinase family protein [Opitutaceae bacterium]